ncbi:MAG: UDP-N-acetylmuramoyl-tripeptide--D-alanyl-D-alanine ligase [Ruminococcaceae bacterium]|nr:UDP-N-acetylmuramoyl-tripeptide--D-alanyl-D-alanine ligase [Oscillospiraceae bacterium]
MDKIIEFIFSIRFFYAFCSLLAVLSAVFGMTRQMQMFQQNSYFPSRYLPWLKGDEKGKFILRALFFVTYAVIIGLGGVLIAAGLLLIFAVGSIIKSISVQKKSIIPLKFTMRVKRMYASLIVIGIIITVLQYLLLKGESYWLLSLNVLLAVFPYLSVLLLWAVMYPTEKMITKHYINDAKNKLASFGGKIKVIGITGSFGKTSSKNILTAMLKEKYEVFTTPKNFNTTLGVVRSIREYLKPQTEIFVCEMGAKKTGDIKELCDLVSPDCALITTVGPQHLDTFGSVDNVFKTKFELYDSVKQKDGKVFTCGESEEIKSRIGGKDVILYGSDDSFSYYADNVEYTAQGESFDLHLAGETVKITTKLLGSHNVMNIVGAAAVAHSFGVSAEQIRFAVSRLIAPEHRLEIKRYAKGSTLIDDAYNSNPVGCLEACRVLSRFAPMKRVLITPGLVELGSEEYKHNFRLGEVAGECADYIILVGVERSKPIREGILKSGFNEENLFVAENFGAAYNIYLELADSNTAVLIENDLPDNYLK